MATPKSPYRPAIERIAGRFDLDPLLVEAVIWQESSSETDKFRWEPGYYRRYIKGKPEWADWIPRRVASSYGLGQVMFPTALLNGWHGDPEELFLPEVGINACCARLRFLLTWADGLAVPMADENVLLSSALAAYNGGQRGNGPGLAVSVATLNLRTADYPPKVKGWLTRLRT